MEAIEFSHIDLKTLLRSPTLEDYICEKIKVHLEVESLDMEGLRAKVGDLNAMEYQDLCSIEGITGEMLKWWCMMDENEYLKKNKDLEIYKICYYLIKIK